ncbi:MAG: sugar phosphate isomerase/epimerase [Chloroflexi bacterium]|nr:sugar phosphate isomerase/epimerase [Chloroflexota bacterium]
MKLGISTWGMPTVPIDVAIRHIAQLGYDGLELTVLPNYTTRLSSLDRAARQRIAALLQEHSLGLPAIAAHADLLERDPQLYAQELGQLQAAIDLAVDLAQGDALPAINTTAGAERGRWPEVKSLVVDRVGEVAEYARSRGVVIAIEPHYGSAIDTPERVLELLALVDAPNLKVNFDISHFDIVGLEIEATVAALAPYSVHTHVKDERGRYPDFEFLIPGEGDFDYVTYLRAMKAHGYTGFITVEISNMVQRRPDYDPLGAATFSYQTLADAFTRAGIDRA